VAAADIITTGGGDDGDVSRHRNVDRWRQRRRRAGDGGDRRNHRGRFSVVAGADQTTGDTANVRNFENLDASALITAISVTGSTSANTITTGSGGDTIDGQGGADVINSGAGNDTVGYWGTETSIDGGTGTNTLLLRVSGTINLGNVDQTVGDLTSVTNFQDVDASGLSNGASITGSAVINVITGGSGGDSVDGGGGADIINTGGGNDNVVYRGTEASIDGGSGGDTLLLAAMGGITAVNFAVAAGTDKRRGLAQRHQFREPERIDSHNRADRHRLFWRQQYRDRFR
jgi:hypothetical protein